MNLTEFVEAYATAALWSSTGDDGLPLDDTCYLEDISERTYQEMQEDCEDFVQANSEDLRDFASLRGSEQWSAADLAGHDFWLTRNGHGAGFWDRGLGELGERLTKAAKAYGGVDLYIGDDGKVYS